MPECGAQLVYTDANKIKGIVCHMKQLVKVILDIISQQGEERHYYRNRILLCPNCRTGSYSE
jgi:hypothetical protein